MSTVWWKDVPTRTVDVGGVEFAYRELGTGSDVPVVFLHHFTAVLDDWDPRVIDGIAAERRVIAFDNRRATRHIFTVDNGLCVKASVGTTV